MLFHSSLQASSLLRSDQFAFQTIGLSACTNLSTSLRTSQLNASSAQAGIVAETLVVSDDLVFSASPAALLLSTEPYIKYLGGTQSKLNEDGHDYIV